MTPYSHQTKHESRQTNHEHENRQTMETKDTCYCHESFIDRSFLVWEILRGGHKVKKAHGE